ncbi:uncharacterized protein LOC122360694 [Puntigrus tetrazona]|uniref:uncharacterized protein LOC122360694 n=1 Tax=Puntigrus tetrazona TaxID=1606681 RepID=UPI001C8930A3|nr:uncharacterized protein LOC122360694 [Puntigrus tetrazona]
MLVFLLIASMFRQGLAVVSYGDNFITVFPENIGFFYPSPTTNRLRVTTLHDNTNIKAFYNNVLKIYQIPMSGQTLSIVFPKSAEVNQLGPSTLSVRITSDKDITVVSISSQMGSTQTYVVQPTVNLGTNYLIPLLDYPDYLQSFNLPTLVSTTIRYSSYKLLIINAVDSQNSVTIVKKTPGAGDETFSIDPYQLVQLQTNGSIVRVKSSKEVAVILTHPCVETENCNCNMVMNQILPTEFYGRRFILPSIFNVAETKLLMLSENASALFYAGNQLQVSASTLLPFTDLQKSQLLNSTGPASLRLFSPGLIVELIPENRFSACYLLQLSTENGKALVIAETNSKDDVHTNRGLLSASDWTEVAGTIYSSVIVTIPDKFATIWHPTSRIAVYMLEYISAKVIFASPAIPINTKPDLHGCVLIPGAFAIGKDPLNWKKSREYCMNNGNQFACPITEAVQKDMADNLTKEDGDGWIGLRRSLLTTDWYWQEEYDTPISVNYLHWDYKQPLDLLKGFCTSVSLDPKNNFKWRSARCCDKKKPVCYKRPAYLNPLGTINSINFV